MPSYQHIKSLLDAHNFQDPLINFGAVSITVCKTIHTSDPEVEYISSDENIVQKHGPSYQPCHKPFDFLEL